MYVYCYFILKQDLVICQNFAWVSPNMCCLNTTFIQSVLIILLAKTPDVVRDLARVKGLHIAGKSYPFFVISNTQ